MTVSGLFIVPSLSLMKDNNCRCKSSGGSFMGVKVVEPA